MSFYIYKDIANEWRWFMYAANSKKIADSGEGYIHKGDCLHGIALVDGGRNLPIYEI